MSLSSAARAGIARLTAGLPRSVAAEYMERAEELWRSPRALNETVAHSHEGGLMPAIAGALKDEMDGAPDPWGVEDPDQRAREDLSALIAEREAAGDTFMAGILRESAEEVEREEAEELGRDAARERAAAEAAAAREAEAREIAAIFGDRSKKS